MGGGVGQVRERLNVMGGMEKRAVGGRMDISVFTCVLLPTCDVLGVQMDL